MRRASERTLLPQRAAEVVERAGARRPGGRDVEVARRGRRGRVPLERVAPATGRCPTRRPLAALERSRARTARGPARAPARRSPRRATAVPASSIVTPVRLAWPCSSLRRRADGQQERRAGGRTRRRTRGSPAGVEQPAEQLRPPVDERRRGGRAALRTRGASSRARREGRARELVVADARARRRASAPSDEQQRRRARRDSGVPSEVRASRTESPASRTSGRGDERHRREHGERRRPTAGRRRSSALGTIATQHRGGDETRAVTRRRDGSARAERRSRRSPRPRRAPGRGRPRRAPGRRASRSRGARPRRRSGTSRTSPGSRARAGAGRSRAANSGASTRQRDGEDPGALGEQRQALVRHPGARDAAERDDERDRGQEHAEPEQQEAHQPSALAGAAAGVERERRDASSTTSAGRRPARTTRAPRPRRPNAAEPEPDGSRAPGARDPAAPICSGTRNDRQPEHEGTSTPYVSSVSCIVTRLTHTSPRRSPSRRSRSGSRHDTSARTPPSEEPRAADGEPEDADPLVIGGEDPAGERALEPVRRGRTRRCALGAHDAVLRSRADGVGAAVLDGRGGDALAF